MKTVCVIGAGQAGLAAIKELSEAGLDVTAFERSATMGGRWSLEEKRGVWEGLTLNIHRRFLEFSDFPWQPGQYPSSNKDHNGIYPSAQEYKEYLLDYAKTFDLGSKIQCNSTVTKIQQNDGKWTVEVQSGGSTKLKTFDGLVICSGWTAKPRTPTKLRDIFKDFSGEAIHAQDFTAPKNYKGKKVLVVGSGVSGADITSLLSKKGECEKVVNSVRTMPYRVHVFSYTTKQPFDDILFTRLPTKLAKVLPESMNAAGLKSIVLENWPEQPSEKTSPVVPDTDITAANFFPDRYYIENLKAGNFSIATEVELASGKVITFKGGDSEEFDAVIFATGYDFDVSFLPDEVQSKITFENPTTRSKDLGLYKTTLAPGVPNLAFVGMFTNYGGHSSMSEMQSRWLAAIFTGKLKYPTDNELQAGVEKLISHRSKAKGNAGEVQMFFCDDLALDLGVAPSIWKCLWNPKKLLLGPAFPCYYRSNPAVDGEELAEKSLKLFDEYMANPLVSTAL